MTEEEKKEDNKTEEKKEYSSKKHKSTERDKRNLRYRKKFCSFCKESELVENLDYKNYKFLFKFLTNRGKIISRRFTGTCSKHQRILSKEIKLSRMIGLLPFKI